MRTKEEINKSFDEQYGPGAAAQFAAQSAALIVRLEERIREEIRTMNDPRFVGDPDQGFVLRDGCRMKVRVDGSVPLQDGRVKA